MAGKSKPQPSAQTIELGAIFSGLLGRKRIPQRDLADAIGESEGQVSRMLRGLKHWDLDQIVRASEFLEVNFVDVITEASLVAGKGSYALAADERTEESMRQQEIEQELP